MDIYVIDDNFAHRKYIQQTIEKSPYFLEYELNVIQISEIPVFLEELTKETIHNSDLFLIDIDLNYIVSGIDIAEKIRSLNIKCIIVFISAYPNKTLEIVSKQIIPFDYIIKETHELKGLSKKINKILKNVLNHFHLKKSERLIIDNRGAILSFDFYDINYISTIKGNRNQIYIQTKTKDFIVFGKLSTIKAKITVPFLLNDFKSYIINIKEIAKIERKHGVVTFNNGNEIFVSIKIIDKILKEWKRGETQ